MNRRQFFPTSQWASPLQDPDHHDSQDHEKEEVDQVPDRKGLPAQQPEYDKNDDDYFKRITRHDRKPPSIGNRQVTSDHYQTGEWAHAENASAHSD